jgi:hypothetical protein
MPLIYESPIPSLLSQFRHTSERVQSRRKWLQEKKLEIGVNEHRV